MLDQSTSLITVRGRYFWRGNERFLIKGVVYRLHGQGQLDPLADDRIDDLERDITLFKDLGLNVLFVYFIDSSKNHNASMALLAKAGIYVLVGLPASTPNTDGITTTFRSYNTQLLDDCFATIDCMSQYPNTLGLIVANGALSTIYSTALAPMIKTVVRDVKKYMTTAASVTGQRYLPVGYSASRTRLILRTTFDYFTAGDEDEAIDFFCYANFNWCGQSTMHISGYNNELKVFADARIPIFFSQYGCNLGGDRIFQETTAIYSPAMTRVFSGGVAYEFYDCQDALDPDHSGYGLVRAENAVVGSGLTKLADFHSLKSRLAGCANVVPETDADQVHYVVGAEPAGYPPLSGHWKAGYAMPYSLVDWEQAGKKCEEERWIDVQVEEIPSRNVTKPSALLPRGVKV